MDQSIGLWRPADAKKPAEAGLDDGGHLTNVPMTGMSRRDLSFYRYCLLCISFEIHCVLFTQEVVMATQTSMLHVRIDDDIKAQANAALGHMGMSMSEAVRIFLHRIAVDQAFPLELKVPNAKTRLAMAEAEEIVRTNSARFESIDELFDDLKKNSGE